MVRVLVADDNSINRTLVTVFLESLDCESVEAQSGPQAIEIVETGGVDLVLMDLQMPDMDGLEATRRIRDLPEPIGQIPVLAVTACDAADTARRCRDAGMNDFIGKPLTRDKLMAVLAPWRAPA